MAELEVLYEETLAWPLAIVALMMWFIIIDRFWFTNIEYPRLRKQTLEAWSKREDHTSWYARQIREEMISKLVVSYRGSLLVLQNLIAVCPLMGLLGTVMGMLEVFDAVALSGNSNVRAMASGVSQATVSTMIGMVIALSGLYFGERFRRGIESERRKLEDLLSSS
ncbi:MAG: MotA/TolQ/ExbB proton channel family protein [Myxococcota bacterium]